MSSRRLLLLALLLVTGACGKAPSPTSPAPSRIHPHVEEDPFRFAAVGDLGNGSESQASVAAAIAKLHESSSIELLLLLGDLIYEKGNPSQFEEKFARPYTPVTDAKIEYKAVLGNHDVQTDALAVREAFGMPARFYTFNRGPVQFFALDASRHSIDEEQFRWLEDNLTNSRNWKVAFMHIPVYSSLDRGLAAGSRDRLANLIQNHGVQLVLGGHDHDYQKFRKVGNSTYVVSGGGCCPRPGADSEMLESRAEGLHFLEIEVVGESMVVTALDPSLNSLDEFEIGIDATAAAA